MTKLTTERVHELKIYPEFFHPVCTGNKRAELRKNDRDYRVGDTLRLFEYSYTTGHTGEYINVIVTHVADVSAWLPDYVLLSIKLPGNDAAPVLPKQPDNLDELMNAVEEVLRISDRDHDAWDRARAAMADIRNGVEAPAQPVIPERPDLRYGDNVLWFLNELAAFDASDIDSDDFDVYGEDRNGMEGCATISITELAADAAKLLSAQPVSEHYKLEIDMDDADHFSITHLHEIIYGKELIWPEAKLLARFMLDVKQRASAAPAQESE